MKSRVRKTVRISIIGLTLVLISVACQEKRPQQPPVEAAPIENPQPLPPPPSPPRAYFTHTVRYPGETISIIAGWYTGDIMNYHHLQKENPDIDPKRVTIGDKILIPEELMKKMEPMPKSYVDSFYPKPKPPPPPPKPPQEDIELIPPKL